MIESTLKIQMGICINCGKMIALSIGGKCEDCFNQKWEEIKRDLKKEKQKFPLPPVKK